MQLRFFFTILAFLFTTSSVHNHFDPPFEIPFFFIFVLRLIILVLQSVYYNDFFFGTLIIAHSYQRTRENGVVVESFSEGV